MSLFLEQQTSADQLQWRWSSLGRKTASVSLLQQEMGETSPEVMTAVCCHVKEATPDSTAIGFLLWANSFWLRRVLKTAGEVEAQTFQAIITRLTPCCSKTNRVRVSACRDNVPDQEQMNVVKHVEL